MRHAPARMIGNRLGVGDHEEGEQQERAALQLMAPDGHALPEPRHTKSERRRVEGEKRECDVGAASAVDDETAERDEPSCESEVRSPLARGHPGARQEHEREDDPEVPGIEEVLAAHANQELRADRDDGSERVGPGAVGAQQQREAERGDRCTARARAGFSSPAITQPLGRDRGDEREHALLGTQGEIAEPSACAEQRSEHSDLEDPRIARQCPRPARSVASVATFDGDHVFHLVEENVAAEISCSAGPSPQGVDHVCPPSLVEKRSPFAVRMLAFNTLQAVIWTMSAFVGEGKRSQVRPSLLRSTVPFAPAAQQSPSDGAEPAKSGDSVGTG